MADYSITIQNATSLYLHGLGPTTKWDNAIWDSDKWDEGSTEIPHYITKFLDNSLNLDSVVFFSIIKFFSNTLDFVFETDRETLTDSNGWNYVFVKPTTDADEQVITSFTAINPTTATWSSASVNSTTWS